MPRIFDNIEQQLLTALQETLNVSDREGLTVFSTENFISLQLTRLHII